MKLAIIILNWHAAADTIACIQPILGWQTVQPTIWVVDNASIDDSIPKIEAACPTVRLIRNQHNQGFSGGTNRGLEAALAETTYPILLLNNDATIAESAVIRLLQTLDACPKAGLVGPCLFDAETPSRLLSAGGKNPVLHVQTRHPHLEGAGPCHVVNHVSGTAVIVRPELFQTVGLLDEQYFFSTEMADLCARARAQGYQCLIDGRARASHTLSRSASYRNSLYIYYIVRNRFIYIRKFYANWAKLALMIFWAAYGLALMVKLQLGGETTTAVAVRLGTKDGLQGRFGGQNDRVLAHCQQAAHLSVVDEP